VKTNTLRLGKHTFPVTHATFFRLSQPGDERPSWEFEIRTGPPLGVDAKSDDFYLYPHGVRLYSEGDPVPLPDTDDLTGVELYLKPPFDPKYNDPYFTLYVHEHGDVSEVRLQFVKRRGVSYRLKLTGLANNIEEKPLPLEVDTWIKWQPAVPD
jgi:hypothetical protein